MGGAVCVCVCLGGGGLGGETAQQIAQRPPPPPPPPQREYKKTNGGGGGGKGGSSGRKGRGKTPAGRACWWRAMMGCSVSTSSALASPVSILSPGRAGPGPYSASSRASRASSSQKKRIHWNATSTSRFAPCARGAL